MEDIYNYLRYTANLIAQSRFGNKLILKGGSVLISKLIECGREDLYRLTSDLDIHCDKRDVWVDFYNNIESILNRNDAGYVYKIIRRRSESKRLKESDSLQFEINDNGKIIKFKIDMNLKSNHIITVEYSPILNMSTYDAYTMMSDKIAAVSSPSIFRRIKDLYDIAVLASIYSFRYKDILKHLEMKHPDAELRNMLIPSNFEHIKHAFDAYKGIRNKPDIQILIGYGLAFLEPVYTEYNQGDLIWNIQQVRWNRL